MVNICINYLFIVSAEIFEVIKQRLFVDEGDGGHSPCGSTMTLADGSLSIVGELMANSIAQEGPPPDFLSGWVYDYLCGGINEIQVNKAKLMETEFKDVATKVSLY